MTIDAEQAVTNIGFQLLAGTVVTINIADPKAQIIDLADLPVIDGRIPLTGATFDLGTFSGIAFTRAALVSKSPTNRTYQATVPSGIPIRIFVNSKLNIGGRKWGFTAE